MGQINSTGEQPLEAVRTHPYHYRAYNLAAMTTNARLAEYLGYNAWNKTTTTGGTIQKAVDFAMAQNPASSNEQGALEEMWPIVATAATKFGDPSGKYQQFLATTGAPISEAFMFWDFHATVNSSTLSTTTSSGLSSKPTGSTKDGGSMGSARVSSGGLIAATLVAFALARSLL